MKTLIALFLLVGLTSCASNEPMDSSAQAMNTTCPMSNEPVDAAVTSMFDGKKIAFCCERCQAKFDGMSNTEKAEKVGGIK